MITDIKHSFLKIAYSINDIDKSNLDTIQNISKSSRYNNFFKDRISRLSRTEFKGNVKNYSFKSDSKYFK